MGKKISFTIVLLFMQVGFAHAQNSTIDSLKHLLQTEKQDSTRSMLLSSLGFAYLEFKPDTALLMAQHGLELAKSIQFIPGEIHCLNVTAAVFRNTGNNAKALELFLEVLKKAESINEPRRMAIALGNIGTVYSDLGDYKKALDYDSRAKNTAVSVRDEKRLTSYLLSVGDDYEKLNQLDSARFYTEQGYDLAVKQNSAYLIGIALTNLGNIYAKMQQPTVAMDNYRLGIPYTKEANNDDNLCEITLGIAKLFQQQKQDDSCLHYAKLSFTTAQNAGFTQRVLNTGNFLAEYFKQHHMLDSAYVYLSIVAIAKDSLFNQQKMREIQNLGFDETMRQQEIAAAKIAEEKERGNNIQFALMGVTLVSFIIIFLLLSRSVVVNERWIRFLGVLALLLLFEFINLYIHPYISGVTKDSPLYMLLLLVAIAALLIPLHHRIEHWVIDNVVEKNKKLRLAAARRTVAKLERKRTKQKRIKRIK